VTQSPHTRPVLVALAALVISTLSFADGKATDENFRRLTVGMAPAEVESHLGAPAKNWTHPQKPSYRIFEYTEDSRVVFQRERVDSVILHDTVIASSNPDEVGQPLGDVEERH
jgi:hypothetical protein